MKPVQSISYQFPQGRAMRAEEHHAAEFGAKALHPRPAVPPPPPSPVAPTFKPLGSNVDLRA